MRSLFVKAALIVSSCFASQAMAAPVQWTTGTGANGHYYDFISAPNILWTSADTAAQALTFNGQQGYLATITSAKENNFLFSTFSSNAGPFQEGWLGGYQNTTAPDYLEPSGGWRWVTGETWNYTNWANAEPDNTGGGQNYLRGGSTWDDMGNDPTNESVQFVSGYFVEYAPEPTSGMLVAGAATFALRRRRISVARSR